MHTSVYNIDQTFGQSGGCSTEQWGVALELLPAGGATLTSKNTQAVLYP